MKGLDKTYNEMLELLKQLIETPSTTKDEKKVSSLIATDMKRHGYTPKKIGLNLLCYSKSYDPKKPTILLNSHMDTVKPVSGWTRNPFVPTIEKDRLYGLGSNDDGAGLVSLLHTFYKLDSKPQHYNILFLATAEEEKSGDGGMKLVVDKLPKVDVALIGEPTGMQPAIAEKGLVVLDFSVKGKAGHAARDEGVNAIYEALDAINIVKNIEFKKKSPLLGPVKVTVTMMQAGTAHNVIPDLCTFTADIRSNEYYSNNGILKKVRKSLPDYCKVSARSLTLNSSRIDPKHPLIKKAVSLGMKPYGSPTLSDQAILKCPSFKLGPGNSSRSHTADEYIKLSELKEAVPTYLKLLDGLKINE